MKKNIIFTIICLFLFSACQLFLGPEPDLSPENVLHSLWKDFNDLHAYVHIRMDNNANFNNWKEVYEHYKTKLNNGELNLFEASSEMLNELSDPHVNLFATSGYFWTVSDSMFLYKKNSSYGGEREEFINITKTYLKNGGTMLKDDLLYGVFESSPNIGYLYISRFYDPVESENSLGWAESINDIVRFFRNNTSAVVIDIRYNTGGISQIMEYVAARFACSQENYLITSAKNGPGRNDFSAPVTYRITPVSTSYTKPVVVLTNKASFSAAEWFTLALRKQVNVRHVGTSTCGALSIRTTRPMINGWYYSISAFKVTDMDGKCYEGFGIRPHVEITGDEDSVWAVHPGKQIEAVLNWMKENI